MPSSSTSRTALVAGATGLVGRAILRGLLADPAVGSVHAVGRRAPDATDAKLRVHVGDLSALPAPAGIDEVYLAIGTTIAIAGSQEAFRAVDFDANLAVARAAIAAGARRAGLVSAMGAHPQSRVFYSRVKGELEEALSALPLDALVIARPSLLLGDRARLGQPPRAGERIATWVTGLLRPITPANYRAIEAAAVARALLARVPLARGREVLLSGAMQDA